MSGLAGLFNVPSVEQELQEWTFNHADHHRQINERIFQLTGIRLPEFILDPVDQNDTSNFTYQHQELHNKMNVILGTTQFDLSDVDLRDRGQLESFIFNNATVHREAAHILRLD